MKRALWLLRRHAGNWMLLVGLALALGALAVQWLAMRPLQEQVRRLESAGAEPPGGKAARAAEAPPPGSPHMQLAAFYGHFERSGKLTQLLAKLHSVGKAAGLELTRAEYRLHSAPERKLDRYQVVMPIRGSYRAIRSFIGTALRELPTMSLDQVQFQRQEVGDTQVDAQVTFTFHLVR